VERRTEEEQGRPLPPAAGEITIEQRRSTGFVEIGRTVFRDYPRRAGLGFTLFVGQAFPL
jgi:hypothetical protein